MSNLKSERLLLTIAKRHMATDFEFALVVDSESKRIGESVLLEAHELVEEIENSLSEFRENADIYRLNHAGPGEWVPFGESFSEILEISRSVHRDSMGMFDPFARSPGGAGFEDLVIDSDRRRVSKKRESVRIGFGAIGKGYALDRVASLLERYGFTDFRLGSGGSSWVFRGFGADGRGWEFAWAWSRDEEGDFLGRSFRLPGGKPVAIGVSGTLEQGEHFMSAGNLLRVSLMSSFCANKSAAEADAFSTALMVGASREGEGFLTKLPSSGIRDFSFAYVDLENQMVYNEAFETSFLKEGRVTG